MNTSSSRDGRLLRADDTDNDRIFNLLNDVQRIMYNIIRQNVFFHQADKRQKNVYKSQPKAPKAQKKGGTEMPPFDCRSYGFVTTVYQTTRRLLRVL
jgi:hypothetical protein